MIVGLGVDIVEVARIEALYARGGERALARMLTEAEREWLQRFAHPAPHIAGRFAAKEAVMKALGTGWTRGVAFAQIEVLDDELGQPRIALRGAAAERAAQLGGRRWHISISHEQKYAVAEAILEGEENDV